MQCGKSLGNVASILRRLTARWRRRNAIKCYLWRVSIRESTHKKATQNFIKSRITRSTFYGSEKEIKIFFSSFSRRKIAIVSIYPGSSFFHPTSCVAQCSIKDKFKEYLNYKVVSSYPLWLHLRSLALSLIIRPANNKFPLNCDASPLTLRQYKLLKLIERKKS